MAGSVAGVRTGMASALADASFDARLRAANAAAAAYDAEAARARRARLLARRPRAPRVPRAEAEAALGRKASPGAKKTGSPSRVVSPPEHETSSKTSKKEEMPSRKASSAKRATTSKRVSKKVSKNDSKRATTSKRDDDDFKRLVLGETEKEGLLAVSRAHAVCTKPLGNAFLGQTGFDEVIKRRLFEIHYKHEEQLAAGADAAAAIGMRPRGGAARTGPSGDGGIAKPGSVWAHAEIIDSYREVQRQMEEVKAAADRARVRRRPPSPAKRARYPMEFDGADYDADARGDVAWTPAATRRWSAITAITSARVPGGRRPRRSATRVGARRC